MRKVEEKALPHRQKQRRNRAWLILVGIGILLLAGATYRRMVGPTSRQILLSACASNRPFEARLTDQKEFWPYALEGYGEGKLNPEDEKRIAAAATKTWGTVEGRLLSVARGGFDLDRNRQRGESLVENSLKQLAQVSHQRPQDPGLLNDLAVAQLFAGRRLDNAEYLVEALESLDQAVSLRPDFEESLFNRGLVLEELYLPEASRIAWERYLELDSASSWAEEARDHLANLEIYFREESDLKYKSALTLELDRVVSGQGSEGLQEIISKNPQAAREYGEQVLLFQCASSWARSDTDAGQLLARGRTLGESLAEANGDRLLEEAAMAISRAEEAGDQQALEALSKAHDSFKAGLDLVTERRLSASLSLFDSANAGFAAAGSPLSGWTRYFEAFRFYLGSDYEATLRVLEEIESFGRSGHYLSLVGRVVRFQGLVHGILGNHSRSIELYRDAYELFEALGEASNLATLAVDLAGTVSFLGDEEEAWSFRLQSLAALPKKADIARRCATYSDAARALRRQKKFAAARYFSQEALHLALEAEDWLWVGTAYRDQASLDSALGNREGALDNLAKARAVVETQMEGSEQQLNLLDIEKMHARLLSETDPEAALSRLSEAVRGHRETDYRYVLPSLLLSKAQILRRLGHYQEAEIDLLEAIAEIERQRTEVANSRSRISFFDQAQDIFEELVLLLEEQGRLEEALFFDEAARARVLQDWSLESRGEGESPAVSGLDASFLAISSLVAGLEPDSAVIQLRSFENSLLIWVLRREEIDRVWVEVAAAELEMRVRSLRRVILENEDPAQIQQTGAALYEVTVEPVIALLDGVSRLSIIPHGSLHEAPFAALFDPVERLYLLERYVLSIAPSASAILRAKTSLSEIVESAPLPALVLGDPTVDTRLYPFTPLPAAREEAEQVADLHGPGAHLLLGEAATASAFLEAAPRSGIIHVAAHAQPLAESPLGSRILLAQGPGGEDGKLEVRDLFGMDLRSTRLVVLSACSTALGSSSQSEGVQNLARPFLAAGAPAVVASLWSINDADTASFMVRFHRHVQEGLQPAVALQKAQLKELTNATPSSSAAAVWAAFEVVGGGV